MQTVAILGAGELGGAIARTLATADVVRHIVLVDSAGPVAAGKALDILQSGPVDGFHTRVTGSAETAQSGAAVVVLADEHGGREHTGDAALTLLRRALEVAPRAVIVAAGATQLSTLEQARELGVPSARLIGSAPIAAQSIACALTAMELDASATDLSMAIVGTPSNWVIAWADATLRGSPLTALLSPPQTLRIEARLRARWPPGPYALASAAAAVVRAIDGGWHRRLTCFVARDGNYERRPFTALPVTLGPSGVLSVHVPPLGARERIALGGD
jgi:malate dehydrogenase